MPATEAAGRPSVRALTNSLAALIERQLSPGEVASLRRLRPEDPSTPAFWRLVATTLEPAGALPEGDGPARDTAERRWAVIIRALVQLRGLHAPGRPLGQSMAEAGVSELRFVRLLQARDEALEDAALATARYLAAKAIPTDAADLAWLLTSQHGEVAESIRRRIARNYFRHTT